MTENSNQPKDYDAVLGGQTPPPTSGVVLGGIEGLRRRFAVPIAEQRVAVLSQAVKYGEAGTDFLIEAMNDEVLIVRASAYKLLQDLSSVKAKKAIANGILLNPGDRIYSVYLSGITYSNDWDYITESISEHDQDDSYYNEPKFVVHHLFKDRATAEAEWLHKQKILQVNVSNLWRPYPVENFQIDQWCITNRVPLLRHPNEAERKFEDRVVKKLQLNKNSELLAQLWELLGFGLLAFIHKDIVQKKTYFVSEKE